MIIDFQNIDFNVLNPKTVFEQKLLIFLKEWFSEEPTVKVMTSGSTGQPKILEVEKNKMLKSAGMTCNFLGLKAGGSALLCLPTEFISGKMMVVRSLERKMILHTAEPSVKPLADLDFPVDFCAMTPLQVENSLDKIHLIKKLIIGGAAVSENLKNKIVHTLSPVQSDVEIYETYGMSETLSHIALRQIFPAEEHFFTIFENIEISADDRGCLKIFAPQLNDENLQTNDMVEIISRTQFRFLGRADNIINSGAAKIFPEELERFIKKEIPNEVVFMGIPDEMLGQKLILVIEGVEEEDLKSKIFSLNFEKSYHKPKEIIFIKEIPRTQNGKVDRLKLASAIQTQLN